MTDPDQQRLAQLQALTHIPREAPQPRPFVSEMLRGVQQRFKQNRSDYEPNYEPDNAFATALPERDRLQPPPDSDDAFTQPPGIQPLPSMPNTTQAASSSGTQSISRARRVQQAASSTLQLRDQREFKLTLEEDTSRDDALVDRLAEQTVAIIQQRDETIYQRVMQAIEQRLTQSRNAFS